MVIILVVACDGETINYYDRFFEIKILSLNFSLNVLHIRLNTSILYSEIEHNEKLNYKLNYSVIYFYRSLVQHLTNSIKRNEIILLNL